MLRSTIRAHLTLLAPVFVSAIKEHKTGGLPSGLNGYRQSNIPWPSNGIDQAYATISCTKIPVAANQTPTAINQHLDTELSRPIFQRMTENTEILREIRDLLRLMAEPALAKRDERLRASLQQIIGKSKQKAEAVLLMNGARSQTDIRKDCGIDDGNLSRLVKALREAALIGPDDKHPKLVFPVPPDLPETVGRDKA